MLIKFSSKFLVLAALSLGFSFNLFGKTGITLPSGQIRNTQYADLKDHPQKSRTYNEFWTYHFHLNGNMQVILNYSRADLGIIKDPVCGSDLSVIGFKGKTYSVAREYPKPNFRFSDAQQQLNVHKNIWFKGALPVTHQVFFKTKKNNISYLIDLSFRDIEAGKTWGDGIFNLGREKVGIYLHIPRAKVAGLIAINSDTVKVSGTGYMDHTFQTDMGPKLVSSGYRYQSLDGNINVGYLLQPREKYKSKVLGFGLVEKGGTLTLIKPQAIKIKSRKKSRGLEIPANMKVLYDLDTISLKIYNDDQQLSVLDEFKGVTRWTVKQFMGGEVIYFRGAGVLNNKLKANYNFFGVK